jgi:hypothetical protein
MYLTRWTSLVQSSFLGARNLVVKNVIVVQVSGLAHLVACIVFATRLWNSTSLSCSSFSQISSTFKRLSGAALDFVPPVGSRTRGRATQGPGRVKKVADPMIFNQSTGNSVPYAHARGNGETPKSRSLLHLTSKE